MNDRVIIIIIIMVKCTRNSANYRLHLQRQTYLERHDDAV